jgi:hypothetical protein
MRPIAARGRGWPLGLATSRAIAVETVISVAYIPSLRWEIFPGATGKIAGTQITGANGKEPE